MKLSFLLLDDLLNFSLLCFRDEDIINEQFDIIVKINFNIWKIFKFIKF
jgi:hypothetical protein